MYRVPFIATTATPRPDPPPPEPSVPTPSPSITVTSPRQFAHFIRQDDVTFFMVDVTDLLHYDPPCPDVELIPLEPDPPSISMAPISTSVPPPSVESTPLSRADAEELTRYTDDLEPAVRDLIREYHDVFPSSFSYAGIPLMHDVEHSIQLVPDYRVHHQAPYRLSIPEATELKRQLEELLRQGFIIPSNSPRGAPVLFARKADGTLRLCINYRGLNRYTVKNIYPMPHSDELFDRLAGNRFFTKIDLRSGYHQILVAAADQLKTAFRSQFGHYEFMVMPFGLTNAPATFQRAMSDIFKDILEQYVLVYLDDIPVYSRTLEEHLRHLRDVLDRLRRHGFYAKLNKCRFAQHKVNFLGHYVSDQGLHMDDAKITAIADAREVADIVFDRVVRDHGLPLSIISDRDPRFTSRFWRRLHEVYGTQLRFSSSYHPQTDGQTEITNRTLGDILRKIVRDDQQWDLHLAHAEIAYNHVVSPATGMSPYYCDLGYHPRVPADFLRPSQMHPDTSCPALDDWVAHITSIMKTAHEHTVASQTRMAARANRSRMDHPFKVGDDVLIDAHNLQLEADTLRKFRRRFFGPCRILQAVGSDTASSLVSFRVKLPDYLRQARVHDVYHVSLLRPYRRPSERFVGRPYERPSPIMVDGHEEFLVSDIIGRRVTNDYPPHVEYLVRWKGNPDEEATWEPLEHLQHARMLVHAYDRARRARFIAPPQPTDPPPSPPAKETAEVEPAPSEADLQKQPDVSERPQHTRRRPARYDD
uniref:Reverse transcriptase n=1 Tax=Chara braunii TaxID=69332 RepID=A0A388KQF5_CHABU